MSVIDRTKDGRNTSANNRKKFLEKYKEQLKKSVDEIIDSRNITDITAGEEVTISIEGDMSEPSFNYHPGSGDRTTVHPGNDRYRQGSTIDKPSASQSEGGAGEYGEDDDFQFTLTKQEFMKIFFENMELPDYVKQKLKKGDSDKSNRAGYVKVGNPSTLNIEKTFKNSYARRIGIKLSLEEKLKEAEKKKDIELIAKLKEKLKVIPYIEDLDVRYNLFVKQPIYKKQAVMFCILDASASMGVEEKELAKRFFILLHLFLEYNYTDVEVRFIRHTDDAEEVNEHDFFYSQKSGGTIVSSALEIVNEIINKEYKLDEWNIYIAQASDGDNWYIDMKSVETIMTANLLPKVQYFAYTEINTWKVMELRSNIWKVYEELTNHFKNLNLCRINKIADIFPQLQKLFEPEER